MSVNEKAVKYHAIKSRILEYVREKQLTVDAPIPSEREWSEITGVSRLTVRRAITELAQEGYLYCVHGKGTFVKQRPFNNNLFTLSSCTQDIISQGKTPSRKIYHAEILPCTSEMASKLKLSPGSNVFSLKRVYRADETPINLTQTYIASDLVPGIEDFNYEKVSLYDVMEKKMGITLTHAERFIKACSAPADVAELLHVPVGHPLLYFEGIVYAKIGNLEKPIENFYAYYSTDGYEFYINQVRQ